jgi:hypothetical protein
MQTLHTHRSELHSNLPWLQLRRHIFKTFLIFIPDELRPYSRLHRFYLRPHSSSTEVHGLAHANLYRGTQLAVNANDWVVRTESALARLADATLPNLETTSWPCAFLAAERYDSVTAARWSRQCTGWSHDPHLVRVCNQDLKHIYIYTYIHICLYTGRSKNCFQTTLKRVTEHMRMKL